jgi:hypothetical protein
MEYAIPVVDEQLAGNPQYDPAARRSRSELFLISYDFQSGGYGVPFYHTINARNLDSARRKAERYLDRFYGSKRESWVERSGNSWAYFGGEVTVKLDGVERTTADQLARRLLIP